MTKVLTLCAVISFLLVSVAAQLPPLENSAVSSEYVTQTLSPDSVIASILRTPVGTLHMPPGSALDAYQRHTQAQESSLQQYSAVMVIKVRLPDTLQEGEFELLRHYAAPRTLEFKALYFTGDGFVRNNVIARLLQSEVDHVRHTDSALTEINDRNYTIAYKGVETIEGRPIHVYKLNPRKKRVGLFKGRIYLDAVTGRLVRTEGTLVKSPSFFIKKVEFLQDYLQVDGLTLLAHMHGQAWTRLVGRVVLDIYQHDYHSTVAAGTGIIAQSPPRPNQFTDQF
jgi:hypothetical protein